MTALEDKDGYWSKERLRALAGLSEEDARTSIEADVDAAVAELFLDKNRASPPGHGAGREVVSSLIKMRGQDPKLATAYKRIVTAFFAAHPNERLKPEIIDRLSSSRLVTGYKQVADHAKFLEQQDYEDHALVCKLLERVDSLEGLKRHSVRLLQRLPQSRKAAILEHALSSPELELQQIRKLLSVPNGEVSIKGFSDALLEKLLIWAYRQQSTELMEEVLGWIKQAGFSEEHEFSEEFLKAAFQASGEAAPGVAFDLATQYPLAFSMETALAAAHSLEGNQVGQYLERLTKFWTHEQLEQLGSLNRKEVSKELSDIQVGAPSVLHTWEADAQPFSLAVESLAWHLGVLDRSYANGLISNERMLMACLDEVAKKDSQNLPKGIKVALEKLLFCYYQQSFKSGHRGAPSKGSLWSSERLEQFFALPGHNPGDRDLEFLLVPFPELLDLAVSQLERHLFALDTDLKKCEFRRLLAMPSPDLRLLRFFLMQADAEELLASLKPRQRGKLLMRALDGSGALVNLAFTSRFPEGFRLSRHLIRSILNRQSKRNVVKALRLSLDYGLVDEKRLNEVLSERSVGPVKRRLRESLRLKSYAKRAVFHLLDLNGLAQILGDPFLRKMTTRTGTELEGWSSSKALSICGCALESYLEQKQNLPEPLREVLQDAKNALYDAEWVSRKVHSCISQAECDAVVTEFSRRVQDLEVGESFLMPSGWSGVPPLHSMCLEVQKVERDGREFLNLMVINSGGGTGDWHDECGRFVDAVRVFQMPVKEFFEGNYAQLLLEPNLIPAVAPRTKFHPNDIYPILMPFAVDRERAAEIISERSYDGCGDVWAPRQLSGSCAASSPLAYLRYRLGPEEYEEFKGYFDKLIIRMAVGRFKPKKVGEQAFASIIQKSLDREANIISGGLKSKDPISLGKVPLRLARVRRLRMAYDKVRMPNRVTKPALPTHRFEGSKSAQLGRLVREQRACAAANFRLESDAEEAFYPFRKPNTLQEFGRLFTSRIEELDDTEVTIQTLRSLGRCYFMGPEAQENLQELKELVRRAKPEEVHSMLLDPLLRECRYLTRVLGSADGSSLTRIKGRVALQWSLQIFFEVQKAMLEKGNFDLGDFALSGHGLQRFLKKVQPRLYLFDKDLVDELAQIQSLLSRGMQNVDEDKHLCDFWYMGLEPQYGPERLERDLARHPASSYTGTHESALRKGEYILAERCCEIFTEEQKKQCEKSKKEWEERREGEEDRDVCRSIRDHSAGPLGEKEFEAYWAYANRVLPESFYGLQQLAMAAQLVTHDATYIELPKVEPTVFRLNIEPKGEMPPEKHPGLIWSCNLRRVIDPITKDRERRIDDLVAYDKGEFNGLDGNGDSLALRVKQSENELALRCTSHQLGYYTSRSCKRKALSLSLLMTRIQAAPDDLKRVEVRNLLVDELFSDAMQLKKLLKANPSFASELLEFLQGMASAMHGEVMLGRTEDQSRKAMFLCLDLAAHVCVWTGEDSSPIRRMLKEVELGSKRYDDQLSRIRVLSYASKEPWSPADIKDLMSALPKAVGKSRYSGYFPGSQDVIDSLVLKREAEIRELLKSNEALIPGIMQGLLDPYGIEIQEDWLWEPAQFPFVIAKSENLGRFVFNLLDGSVRVDGERPTLNMHFTEYEEYVTYVGNGPSSWTEGEGRNRTETAFNGITSDGLNVRVYFDRVDARLEGIERQFRFSDGSIHWATPIRGNTPSFPYLEEGVQLWRTESGVFYIKPGTWEVVAELDDSGLMRFADEPGIRLECILANSDPEASTLTSFCSDAQIWQDETSDYKRITLPGYVSEEGESIGFQLHDGSNQWTLATDPSWHLADDQTLQGVKGWPHYLILENDKGQRRVLIPELPAKQLESLERERGGPIRTTCLSIPLVEGQPVTRDPRKSLLLAYVTLLNASDNDDYRRAIKYLKGADKFSAFSPEELRVLGWVFNCHKEGLHDHSGQADAVRLFAAWLEHQHRIRYPSPADEEEEPERLWSLPNHITGDWDKYWRGGCYWVGRGGAKRSLPDQLKRLGQQYAARLHRIPIDLRMEQIIAPFYWRQFAETSLRLTGHESGFSGYIKAPPRLPRKGETQDFFTLLAADEEMDLGKPSLRPRGIKRSYGYLARVAVSGTETERKQLTRFLRAMAYQHDLKIQTLWTLLAAAVNLDDRFSLAESGKALKLLEEGLDSAGVPPADFNNKCNALVERVRPKSHPERVEVQLAPKTSMPAVASDPVVPELSKGELPDKPEPIYRVPEAVAVRAVETEISLQRAWYESCIEAVELKEERHWKPFVTVEEDPYIKNSVELLNADTEKGVQVNALKKRHRLKPGSLVKLSKKVEARRSELSEEVDRLHKRMLELANQAPKEEREKLLTEAMLASEKKRPLTDDECFALFLQGDPSQVRRMTSLQSEDEVNEFLSCVAEFLVKARSLQHLEKIEATAAQCKAASSAADKAQAAQTLGELLEMRSYVDLNQDPAAFLLFEYKVGLYLRETQVSKLRLLLSQEGKFPSKLMQLIQGGGKTLVFGHILALMKADGAHLSVHVPASGQFSSIIQDMRYMSGHVFGQKERVLHFDDRPEYFTPSYLQSMLEEMQQAVLKRNYITLTNESLRALFCKYTKMRTLIMQGKLDEKAEKEVEASLVILKQCLAILKQRSVFTMDESHLAFDPKTELNMPTGDTEPVNPVFTQLIASVVRYAADAKGENGEPLMQLKANRQSLQTKEQRAAMLQIVVDKIVKDPRWRGRLGIDSADKEAIVRRYISTKDQDLPEFLHKLHDTSGQTPTGAECAILLHMLIAEGWFGELLEKSVNEHFGFTQIPNRLRVAIPYLANMTPAEGSEFSDRIMMTIKTMLTYSVEGLDRDQVKSLLRWQKEQVIREIYRASQEGNRIGPSETETDARFVDATGMSLTELDVDDEEQVSALTPLLAQDNAACRELTFAFVNRFVLPQKLFFRMQVTANGQTTAGMANSVIGYSGSFDNPHLAPHGTEVLLEEGTNGQTIDLLTRENNDIFDLSNDQADIWRMLKEHERSKDIRAFIDVGAHFRGMRNDTAAREICRHLPSDSPIKGVLYFDPETDQLAYMPRDKLDSPVLLSGTSPTVIANETECSMDQLFTFYDQLHITGVDIHQKHDAVAIMPISEHTKIHEILQGARRLRGLEDGQRIVFAVSEAVKQSLQTRLKRDVSSVRDLVLHAHIKEVEKQKEENLLVTLQKLQQAAQQAVLDRIYATEDLTEERRVFEAASRFFIRDVEFNLYKKYAKRASKLQRKKYLQSVATEMLTTLKPVLSEEEYSSVEKRFQGIQAQMLEHIPEMVAAPESVQKGGTHVVRQQQKQHMHIESILESVSAETEGERGRRGYSGETGFYTPSYKWKRSDIDCSQIQQRVENAPGRPVFCSLNAAIQQETSKEFFLFSPDLLVTDDFAKANSLGVDLLKNPKFAHTLLLFELENGKKKLAFCSARDADSLVNLIPKCSGRVHLIRLDGRPLASSTTDKIDAEWRREFQQRILEDEGICNLLAQANLQAVRLQNLREPKLFGAFKQWFGPMKARVQAYFQDSLSLNGVGDYALTPAYGMLAAK